MIWNNVLKLLVVISLFVIGSLVYAQNNEVDLNYPWHPLQQIAISPTQLESVDKNGDGRIDKGLTEEDLDSIVRKGAATSRALIVGGLDVKGAAIIKNILTVKNNAKIQGVLTTNSDVIVGRNLGIQGSDVVLGMNDGRNKGSKTGQRALVHGSNDELIVNYGGDFEGGVDIQSNVVVRGILNLTNHRITHLADPIDPQDAATKAYVDRKIPSITTGSAIYFVTRSSAIAQTPYPSTLPPGFRKIPSTGQTAYGYVYSNYPAAALMDNNVKRYYSTLRFLWYPGNYDKYCRECSAARNSLNSNPIPGYSYYSCFDTSSCRYGKCRGYWESFGVGDRGCVVAIRRDPNLIRGTYLGNLVKN